MFLSESYGLVVLASISNIRNVVELSATICKSHNEERLSGIITEVYNDEISKPPLKNASRIQMKYGVFE